MTLPAGSPPWKPERIICATSLLLWLLLPAPLWAALPGQKHLFSGLLDGERFATQVVSGDFDGDQKPDVALSAPESGRIYLLFDLQGGPTERTAGLEGVVLELDQVGPQTLAAADLDQDGITDLVLGEPEQGLLSVILGRSVWPSPLNVAGFDHQLLLPTTGALTLSLQYNTERLCKQLLVGQPEAQAGLGEVILLSSEDLLDKSQPRDVSQLALKTWVGDSLHRGLGSNVQTLADLDGDGVTDTAMMTGDTQQASQLYLLPSSQDFSKLSLASLPSLRGEDAAYPLVSAVVGDLDLDGIVELFIGAPNSLLPGRIYALPLAGLPTPNTALLKANRWETGQSEAEPELGRHLVYVSQGESLLPLLVAGLPNAQAGRGQLDVYDTNSFLGTLTPSLTTGEQEGLGQALLTVDQLDSGIFFASAPGLAVDGFGVTGALLGFSAAQLLSDADGDGATPLNGDCDDTTASRAPALTESCDGVDNNCDGIVPSNELDQDQDGHTACNLGNTGADCNDQNAQIFVGASELCDGLDNDCNGQIPTEELDQDGDGQSSCNHNTKGSDCNDSNDTVYEGATEVCDSLDNNCNGTSDEGLTSISAYEDADGDGFAANDAPALQGCSIPLGYVSERGDCADDDLTRHPAAEEICDGLDNNCDDVLPPEEQDLDHDGRTPCNLLNAGSDCDDNDPNIYEGAAEQCDTIDNNCNGLADEDVQDLTWYQDIDGDGFAGSGALTQVNCARPAGYVLAQGDCNPTNPGIFPDATESCNGIDDDCDGLSDEDFEFKTYYVDADGDDHGNASLPTVLSCADVAGYAAQAGDCDDTDPAIYSGATEVCDGLDNDCNGEKLTDEKDLDQDSYLACAPVLAERDCIDTDSASYPGSTERCDGRDNDCDGQIPGTEQDADVDGYSGCKGDCDDAVYAVNPGVAEATCDRIDTNCDGQLAAEEVDKDGDGFISCDGGDCNDSNALISPGADDGKVDGTCDGIDSDCDGLVPQIEVKDTDGDGFVECDDCNDTRADINPNAVEVPGDGIDNDCSGQEDDVPCTDVDGDGYPLSACSSPKPVDCDDTNSAIHPEAGEGVAYTQDLILVGDGLDNNCNGIADEGTNLFDDDSDGFTEAEGDCNDQSASTSPVRPELANNGEDDDCDGKIDEDDPNIDDDRDGYTAPLDCNDFDDTIHPGSSEIPGNEVDENCDGSLMVDADADGIGADLDCNDQNAAIGPGAEEILNGQDDNCDGLVDEGFDEGPGFSCQALSEADEVAVSCQVGAGPSRRRASPMPWLLWVACAVALRRRKST
ncbi:MAG: putative metal-binding motif-containing protein [Myxococcota bacterium]